jgi:hypothetical protein
MAGTARRRRRRLPSACAPCQVLHLAPIKSRPRAPHALAALAAASTSPPFPAQFATAGTVRRRQTTPPAVARFAALECFRAKPSSSGAPERRATLLLHFPLLEDPWSTATVWRQRTTGRRPSPKSSRSRPSPTLVSTSSLSPHSPLSVLHLTQAPSCPEARELDAPGATSCAWGVHVRSKLEVEEDKVVF